MDRGYVLLDVKGLDPTARRVSGIASTPEMDRQGDMLDPAGVTFRNPVPLLFGHNQKEPIGTAVLTVTRDGITFDATIPTVDDPGPLKTRTDDVWQMLKAGVLSGASIGFAILDNAVEHLRTGGRRLLKTEICELSLVTIPANRKATIHLVKSLSRGPVMNLTTAEHITNLDTKRAQTVARMDAILDAARDGDRGLTSDERTAIDALTLESKSLASDVELYRAREQKQIAEAKPVPSAPRPMVGFPVSVKSNLPKGTAFVRAACAKLICKGDLRDAAEYAERRWPDSPEVALFLKAAVAPGTTTDAVWAKPLVHQNISNDFIELLRPATILGKIKGLKKVPFNTALPKQTSGGTYGWVGESKPKPVTSLGFGTVSLDMSKVAGIVVITKELAMLSNPDAEGLIRDDMVKGIAQFLDLQFIDPAVAAVATVNPASITNGAPTAPATADPLADILGLIRYFAANGLSVKGLTFLMSPANALAFSMFTNADGSPVAPGMSVDGGSYRGMDFITSDVVGGNVIGLQPSQILYAEDGGVEIDVSQEASVQMDSAPDAPPTATTVLVSLWQTNRIGLRAERFVNWNKINPNAVRYLTAAVYPVPGAVGATAAAKK